MPSTPKILASYDHETDGGTAVPGDAVSTLDVLYTVPIGSKVRDAQLTVVNRSVSAGQFDLAIIPAASVGSEHVRHLRYYGAYLDPNDTFHTYTFHLAPADVVRITTDASFTVTLTGVEES